MLIANQPAPSFALPDLSGNFFRLNEYRGKIVIVNFWSCECPHSARTDAALLSALAMWKDEVVAVWVASNRNEHIEAVKKSARERNLPLVVVDAESALANEFGALTTPHVFVIDREGFLRYAGAVDDVSFRNRNPARFFLNEAVEALLAGRLPEVLESPAYGCAIVREI
jgi:peroxiredoxin